VHHIQKTPRNTRQLQQHIPGTKYTTVDLITYLNVLLINKQQLTSLKFSLFVSYGDYKCGFKHSGLPTYQTFCICWILEKKLHYRGTVHQLFINLKEAIGSVMRNSYDILIEFGIHMKLVWLFKMFTLWSSGLWHNIVMWQKTSVLEDLRSCNQNVFKWNL
jgi:hypothetical protein